MTKHHQRTNRRAAGISDIYMNYNNSNSLADKLENSSSVVKSDINKIKELLEDLNANWKGNQANNYTRKINSIIESVSKYGDNYLELSELMKKSNKAYKNIDEHFETEIL